MEILHAIVLGIIEGLTEFLPISSTGHLIVAEDLLGYHDASKLFTVVIQMGAIIAVVWFYRQALMGMLRRLAAGDRIVRRFFLVWVLATIPAAVLGLIFDDMIEDRAVTLTVAWALIVGGVLMWLVETYHRSPVAHKENMHKITTRQAVKIGFFQVLALVPGVSRSGATIIGGMLAGLDRVTATAFSFYLGIPILLLAGGYKLATGDIASVPGGTSALAVGLITSFITAFFAVGWLLRYVSRHDFKPFAYYRIIFGIILLIIV